MEWAGEILHAFVKNGGSNVMARNDIVCRFSNEGTRNEVRMRVVYKLSEETPDTGNGDGASRFIYIM